MPERSPTTDCIGKSGDLPSIEASPFTVGARGIGDAVARCPGEERALGGGVVHSDSDAHLYMRASGPRDATGLTSETRDGDIPKQWYASVLNYGVERREGLKVFAICE